MSDGASCRYGVGCFSCRSGPSAGYPPFPVIYAACFPVDSAIICTSLSFLVDELFRHDPGGQEMIWITFSQAPVSVSSSGKPATDVAMDRMPASIEADATMGQLTSPITAAVPTVATNV